uniref:5'-deoxynucleotidase HDDC2 n=1 Tax=Acrobeloides nanus TaxID=290746 RepID=A0A914C1H8_9BILA
MTRILKIFELIEVLDKLKHLKRTGWVHHNVPEPETVACHMYRMAMLAMALAEELPNVDIVKCVKMSLVHDLGEAIAGDITPRCGITDEQKFDLEEKAFKEISALVPESIGSEWLSLWEEYEKAGTLEAKVVKQLDKFDMVAQAFSYEKKFGVNLEEFFATTTNMFLMEPFITWDKQLRVQRDEFHQSKPI